MPCEAPSILIVFDINPDTAKRNAEVSFVFFVLGGVVGLFNLTATLPFGAGFEMVAIAKNLATHGSFANPLLVMQTGPTAVAPPLYPLLMAFLMKVLHAPAVVLLAVALGDVCANAATAALLPRVSWLFFADVRPGAAAAIFWLMASQLMPSWDASYTLTILLLFCLYSASTIGKAKIFIPGVSAGLLAGVLFLLNPMSLLVFFPWLAYLLVFRNTSLKRAAAYCCIVLGTVALIAFPWTLRNYHQLGAFVVRTGLGLNIYFSNNDCSRTNLVEDLQSGCSARYQPNFNVSEAEAVRDMGEVGYDRRRLADAEAWMRAHPSRFVNLTTSRFVTFWFPRRVEHPFKASVIWVFTFLSLPGLALMAYRRVRVTIFILLVLLVYPLVYYVIVADVRYRYPILWLSLLPAGYFLEWLIGLVRAKWQSRSAWGRTPPSSQVSQC